MRSLIDSAFDILLDPKAPIRELGELMLQSGHSSASSRTASPIRGSTRFTTLRVWQAPLEASCSAPVVEAS
jgi:hypothetical protein